MVEINKKGKLNNPLFFVRSSFEVKLLNDSKVFFRRSNPQRKQHSSELLGTSVESPRLLKTVSLPFQVSDGCSFTAYKLSRAMTGNHYYAYVSIWVTDHSIKAHSPDLCAL